MGTVAFAQQVERQIRETVQRPVASVQMREETETVLTPEYSTQMQDVDQVLMRPVSRVSYQPRVHNWWNPFAPTYTAWHPTVVTQWEPQVVKTRVATTTTQYRQETRVVQRPTRVLRMVQEEQTRIVRSDAPAVTTGALVHQPHVAPRVVAPSFTAPQIVRPAAPIVATPATPIEIARQPTFGSLQTEEGRLRGGIRANEANVYRR